VLFRLSRVGYFLEGLYYFQFPFYRFCLCFPSIAFLLLVTILIGHNSAFEAIQTELVNKSILLNGRGDVTRYNNNITATLPIPQTYNITFERPISRPKRYLLRIINTSFEATFVFSIDNHNLTVVESDFVPIRPYVTNSILVGIGQRYHVIVEANPIGPPLGPPIPADGNFWIRTYRANCFGFKQGDASPNYMQTGILRYDPLSTADPVSLGWKNVPLDCSDEPYSALRPVLPWQVGKAANDPFGNVGENFTVQGNSADAGTYFNLAFFSIGGDDFRPLRIDYANPTFLNLNNSDSGQEKPASTKQWNPLWVVFPENYTSQDWVGSSMLSSLQSPWIIH